MTSTIDFATAPRGLTEIELGATRLDRFDPIIGSERAEVLHAEATRAATVLAGRTVWNVNSTGRGGGVAEMLHVLLPYALGAGIDARWLVIEADDEFFTVTKRLHNRLHNEPGDGGALDDHARQAYERTLDRNKDELLSLVRPGDLVVFHDPQTAGLVPVTKPACAAVLWRCHIGSDAPGRYAHDAWDFLRPYVSQADRLIFTCEEHVWSGLDRERVELVAPSIDAFSPKNQELDAATVDAILHAAGILASDGRAAPEFIGGDGQPARVVHQADMIGDGPLDGSKPIVVQVSRWDRLKDPVGVVRGFAEFIAARTNAQLVLAGPESAAIADDPEGVAVMNDVISARDQVEPAVRGRIHLACLPMQDDDENGVIVNALQRGADVVVQKSLAEGFGLTVAEAMWKRRAVVASARGGIRQQVVHDRTGLLLDDPEDLEAFGAAVTSLITDPDRAARLGAAAHEHVREHFLAPRHLLQYAAILAELVPSS